MAPTPNPIDVHVGARLRLQRHMLRVSQTALGNALGVTFQQVQKYENGINRISASRLQMIAGILNVPVSFFFEDEPAKSQANSDETEARLNGGISEFLSSKDGLNLNRAFIAIKDENVRRSIVGLVKVLAGDENE